MNAPRRPINTQPFQDPLENYDPKQYDDPLERALAEENVTAIQSQPFAGVGPATPIAEALGKLVGEQIACLLVVDDGRLVGVFSDRDVLEKVALEYDQLKDRPVREVMSPDPVHVYETDSAATALTVMAVSGYRHVPVVDVQGNAIGIVSPQRVTAFLRERMTDA